MVTRYVQGRSAVLEHTFYADSTPVDPSPGTPTVTVKRADGTILVDSQTATHQGTGVYTYTLSPTQTLLLDRLTVTWTATFDAVEQTFVDTAEIAGDVLFTLPDIAALSMVISGLDPEKALAMRTTVEDALEGALGYALVPRYERRTVTPRNGRLRLSAELRSIRSIDGSTSVSDLVVDEHGIVTGRAWSRLPVLVEYEHGLDGAPMEARLAGLRLAKAWLVQGPFDERTTVISSPDSGITATLAVPGRGGSIFGVPNVDQFVQSNQLLLGA